MTLNEWITYYEKKTGEKFKAHPSFKLLYLPERGFCEVQLEPKTEMVMAYQLCGDGHFWKDVLDSIALLVGYGHGGAICVRHIKPYIRFWGFRIIKTNIPDDGSEQYICKDKAGHNAKCSPAWTNADGSLAYYITWEIG